MKKILVTIEALSDTYYSELAGKTPLASAKKPNMDFFASIGATGTIEPLNSSILSPPQNLLRFYGFDAVKSFPGTPVLEALGHGLEATGIVFGTTLMALDGEGEAHPITVSTEEAKEFFKYLNRHVLVNAAPIKMRIIGTENGRGLILVEGNGLNNKVVTPDRNVSVTFNSNDTVLETINPEIGKSFKIEPCIPVERSEESRRMARILNEITIKSKALLSAHPANRNRVRQGQPPANFILVRGPTGTIIKKRFENGGSCLLSSGLEMKGFAKLLEINYFELKGSFEDRMRQAVDFMKRNWDSHDFFHVHVKDLLGPSVKGNLLEKKALIEKIDKSLFFPLTDEFDLKQVRVCVAGASHAPCSTRFLESKPTPFLIAGLGVKPDASQSFSEEECAKGVYKAFMAEKIPGLLSKQQVFNTSPEQESHERGTPEAEASEGLERERDALPPIDEQDDDNWQGY